jgi:Uma2 family endonuclease
MVNLMNVVLPTRLDFDDFLVWAARQEEGKYELIDGVVIMQQSQQWGHSKAKAAAYVALSRAVADAHVDCYVGIHGPTVRVSTHRGFVPDVVVAPLPEPALDSLEIPNPIVVVEVLSPSTARLDTTSKLRGYFQVPSIQHYLIVDPEGQTVTHHKRGVGTALETRILSDGALVLDPPGTEVRIGELFGPSAS